ncbi:MAG: hypothetical protein LBJ32_00925 [Oscillospiraceae bacterium]|nr:hypothetical protein [Oscillospiraceae bacterium]
MLRKRIKSFGITNTRYLEPALIKLKYKFLGNFLARFGAFGAVWSASSDEKNKKMPKKISKNCIYNFGKNKFSNKTKNKKVFLVNKEKY